MASLQTDIHSISLPLFAKSNPISVFLLNKETIVLVFEHHLQIWSIIYNKFVHRTHQQNGKFYWRFNTVVNQTLFAYITSEPVSKTDKNKEWNLYLTQFDLTTLTQVQLVKIPYDKIYMLEYKNLLYFSTLSYYAITLSNAVSSKIILWDGKAILEYNTNHKGDRIEKYNSELLSICSEKSQNSFETLQFLFRKEVNIRSQEQNYKILIAKQFSKTEAILGFQTLPLYKGHEGIMIYDIQKNQITKQHKLQSFLCDIMSFGEVYFSVEQKHINNRIEISKEQCWKQNGNPQTIEINVKMKKVFKQKQSTCNLITYQNSNLNKECNIQIITYFYVSYKSKFIFLMEQANIIKNFGSQIVKAVINNLY